ncbi:MAG: zinc-binding dehydrogenase [Bifidobacteriaceae bacterium]|jgi:threonine dehydrogenase-like Zn-dependent dehydrogenase|nr:zinc-binding dehydrogenase [Bifidobacteriaceae bacterium]
MKALVVDQAGQLSVDDLPMPQIGPYQALTRTVSCGVCAGTDSKLIHGHFKGHSLYPAALGHEAIGEVIEVGAKVTSFRPGDLVTLPFLYEAVDGVYPAWGSFAEFGVIGDAAALAADGIGQEDPRFDQTYLAQKVLQPGDKVTPQAAAMIVTLREVYSAALHFGMAPGQSAVVFGAGPVGLSFTRFAALIGLEHVLTIDIDATKLAEATAAGATHVLDSTQADPVAWVRSLVPEGVDYVVDAVGLTPLLNQGMGMIKDRGKLCAYGISPQTSGEIDWSAADYNWTLQFQQMPRKAEEGAVHAQIMDWINAGVLDVDAFISHYFDFDHILDAFALVAERRPGTKKIIITYPQP